MNNIRIIPRLDIKGPNLVKGIHLEGLRVLGKPFRFAQYYYESGADELLYMDVVASLYGRNSLLDIVSTTAQKIFIPITVGGGLRTIDDIHAVLRAGADKVAINTAAIKTPAFITEASQKFGSSTIVVSVEAKRKPDGSYEAYIDNGREKTGVDALAWAKRAVELGAGEVFVTSIDQEGTGKGYDVALVNAVASAVSVPVVACGGAGSLQHISEVIIDGRADAVSFASMLHYHFIEQFKVIDDLSSGDSSTFLKTKTGFSKVQKTDIMSIKTYLHERKIQCRL